MAWLIRVFVLLIIGIGVSHADQKTKDELESTITTQLPSSGTGAITAAILRQVLQDMVDSNQQIPLLSVVTSTSYTFLTSDQGKYVPYDNSSAGSWTLPAASGEFAGGYNLYTGAIGTGDLTITASAGTICNVDTCASTLELQSGTSAFLISEGLNVYRAIVIYNDFSPLADTVSNGHGAILYRGSSAWQVLEPGSAGQTLTTSGVGEDPLWTSAGSGTVFSITCGTGLDGGTITASGTCDLADVLSSGSAGGSTLSLSLTWNDQGQVTSVTSQTISGVLAGSIADASKTGSDSQLVTGTAGTSGDLSQWNADGDLVDGPTPPSGAIVGTSDTQTLTNKTLDGDDNTFLDIALGALESIADGRILGNVAGSASPAIGLTFSQVADTVSDQQGTILYRDSSNWVALEPGTSGQFLQTNGTGSDPSWESAAGGGTVTSVAQGVGLTFSSNPITASGTISLTVATLTSNTSPTQNDVLYGETAAGSAAKFNIDEVLRRRQESFVIAASDETTAITATTSKVIFRMPYAFTVSDVRASLTTAQSSGSTFTVSITEDDAAVLSTQITLDNGELSSTTASTPPVISNPYLGDDAEIGIHVDQIGDGTAAGLKVIIIGTQQ